MIQEEKQLLLKDLSSRLPYQPLCKKVDTEDDFCECNAPLGYSLRDFVDNKIIIKPYLRPLSSMTEEERLLFYQNTLQYNEETGYSEYTYESIDWLNAHHFDYRGLIEKGLAKKITIINKDYE